MKILVIGAGIFGCSISNELNNRGFDVTLIESESDIMTKASKNNHNRLHLGFHYPRSKETAVQSINGLLSFFNEFNEAILTKFPNYYLIEKNSLVNYDQFKNFCDDIGLFYLEETPDNKLINTDHIEGSLKVNEPIFDFEKLKSIVNNKIKNSRVILKLNTPFNQKMVEDYDYVINTSYNKLNYISSFFTEEKIKIKLQDVIIPKFKFLQDPVGLTIMDGKFCSVIPNGFNKNEFLLYHVKESILKESFEDIEVDKKNKFSFDKIINESQKYYPFLNKVEIFDFYQTIRALPINNDDARLSEIYLYKNNPKLISVISGKISTCVKVSMEIYKYLTTGKLQDNLIL